MQKFLVYLCLLALASGCSGPVYHKFQLGDKVAVVRRLDGLLDNGDEHILKDEHMPVGLVVHRYSNTYAYNVLREGNNMPAYVRESDLVLLEKMDWTPVPKVETTVDSRK